MFRKAPIPMNLDNVTRTGAESSAPTATGAERQGSTQSGGSGQSGLDPSQFTSPPLVRGDTGAEMTISSRNNRSMSMGGSTLTPAEAAMRLADYTFTHRRNRSTDEKSNHSDNDDHGSNAEDTYEYQHYDDFVNCPYIPPVPTSRCLQNFAVVVGRLNNPEVQERRLQKFKRQKQFLDTQLRHEQILTELRNWRASLNKPNSFWGYVKKTFEFGHHAHLPHKQDLIDMAKYYYPIRSEVKIFICDFGLNRFEKHEVPLGRIEEYFFCKPEWADVRWIHAPINAGIVQSSIEDRFLKGNRNVNGIHGNNSWPYTALETLSLQNRDRVENKLDVQRILREGNAALAGVAAQLNGEALSGLNKALLHDMQWRSKHTGKRLTYWETVNSDFVRQLTGGSADQPDSAITKYDGLSLEKQSLHSTPLYEKVQVVRSYFRCFQRADGFLLTFTACGGVDYIDLDLNEHLRLPSEAQAENENCSMVALLFEMFSDTGTSTWYKRNVDWLLIYILTEIAVKPTHVRQGCNAPSILRTYQGIVQDLKRKRYDQFKKKASVDLVRDYLTCIDEITTMNIIFQNTRTLLNRLNAQLTDVLKGEGSITPDNELGESGISRVRWASGVVEENLQDTKELLSDLQESLTALFQLRSIEQNELAIVADSQNKAILVFTGVTIVFLPLSFFTSYFGMNIQGIVDTSNTERDFWKVCGTVGFVLFFLIAFYAFKHKLHSRASEFRLSRYQKKNQWVV